MRWLVNAAVIPTGGFGVYRYVAATIDDLAAFLEEGEVVSRIGYEETANAIARWTGERPPLSRETSYLEPGDVAAVVRLRYRVQDPRTKHLVAGVPDEDWEIGFLERLR